MSLILPGNIPIAAESLQSLKKAGSTWLLRQNAEALVLVTEDAIDRCSVWITPNRSDHRAAWKEASAAGFVDDIKEWGPNVDIDHLFPRSWALSPASNAKYVRLFPVWAEVNRSAGASREKYDSGKSQFTWKHGLCYAGELQVLKLLGHPVGTVSDPVSIFEKSRRSKR